MNKYTQMIDHLAAHIAKRDSPKLRIESSTSIQVLSKRLTEGAKLNKHEQVHTNDEPLSGPPCKDRYVQDAELSKPTRVSNHSGAPIAKRDFPKE